MSFTLPSLDLAHGVSVAVGSVVGAVAGPFVRPYIQKILSAIPNWLVTRAKARYDAQVAAGNVPPPVARLVSALKRAVFDWANKELPDDVGPEKMALAVATLSQLPYIGPLVAANPDAIKKDLQIEYDAWREEIKKEATPAP